VPLSSIIHSAPWWLQVRID